MGDEQGRTVETSEGISDQLCIWSSVACDLMGSIKSGGICAFPVSGSLCSGGAIGWSSKVHYVENTYQKRNRGGYNGSFLLYTSGSRPLFCRQLSGEADL